MTAINIIAQPKARAGYILSDTAYTDPAGVITELGSKIIQGGASFPWAFGVTGNVHPVSVGRELAKTGIATLKQLQRRIIPAMKRAMEHTLAEHAGTSDVSCCVRGVAWAFARKRPIAFVVFSHPEQFVADNGVEPFTWYETSWNVACDCEGGLLEMIGSEPDFTDPGSFDPATDGAALLEAQRSIGMTPTFSGVDKSARYRIGGEAQLTTVTKHGVICEALREWPDRVGQMIDVTPA